MAKSTKASMVRRGRRYQILRAADGTFIRFVPKSVSKKSASKKASARTSSRRATSARAKSSSRRAHH